LLDYGILLPAPGFSRAAGNYLSLIGDFIARARVLPGGRQLFKFDFGILLPATGNSQTADGGCQRKDVAPQEEHRKEDAAKKRNCRKKGLQTKKWPQPKKGPPRSFSAAATGI